MSHPIPNDQLILDEFFRLQKEAGMETAAWLFGMVAVYGLQPEQFKKFKWNDDGSIKLPHRKRVIQPLHPQWLLLFKLKEEQPKMRDAGWLNTIYKLEMSHLDIVALMKAHRIRKVYYTPIKRQAPQLTASAL